MTEATSTPSSRRPAAVSTMSAHDLAALADLADLVASDPECADVEQIRTLALAMRSWITQELST